MERAAAELGARQVLAAEVDWLTMTRDRALEKVRVLKEFEALGKTATELNELLQDVDRLGTPKAGAWGAMEPKVR